MFDFCEYLIDVEGDLSGMEFVVGDDGFEEESVCKQFEIGE